MSDQKQLRPCRVVMCGGLRVEVAGEPVPLVRVQKAGELLALLCIHLDRAYNRDEIVEILWPGVDPVTGRNRLRFTLSSLRSMLEPLGVPRGSVLIAGRNQIAISAYAVSTDLSDRNQALRRAAAATDQRPQALYLAEALSYCSGDFMPGYYSDWIETERKHLTSQFVETACDLAELLESLGDSDGALAAALKATSADPLREDAHRCVLRSYLARGAVSEAVRHYAEMEKTFQKQLGVGPSPETRSLLSETSQARGKDLHLSGSGRPHSLSPQAPTSQTQLPIVDEGKSEPDDSDVKEAHSEDRHGRLPVYFTRFVGRERELAEVVPLLNDHANRLVTLTGLGGIGKTRLAVEAAKRFSTSAGSAPTYVDLLTCTGSGMLIDTIAAACGLRSLPGKLAFERIVALYSGEPALLILDNFEHLLPGGAPLVRSLLEEAPTLSCLATSRLPLEIPGEVEYPVGQMDVPRTSRPADMTRSASVQLFTNRARLVKPDFFVTERNAHDISQICRALEGIPLALELAAAWSASLSPGQMKERVEHPLDLLVSHRAGFHERHRTLRTVLDHSFSLLPPEAQEVFARLSAFRATWTAEAAEAVCGVDALEWLEVLRRSSLVVSVGAADKTRFRLLEPVREYASECHDEAHREETAARHANYYHDLGQTARNYLDGPCAEEWLDILASDEPNIVAALEWCFAAQGNPETGVGLAEALRGLWEMRGYEAERCRWLMTRLASDIGPTPLVQARALGCASYMARLRGDFRQAHHLLDRAVALFREAGDDVRLGFNICLLGQLAQQTGDAEKALSLHRESLGILRRINHEWGVAMTLSSTGKILAYQGRYAEARPPIIASLEEFRRMGDRTAVATVLAILALLEYLQGNFDASRNLEDECLEIRRAIDRPWGIAYSLASLGRICLQESNLAEAVVLISEGASIFERIGDLWGIAYTYHYLGVAASRAGESRAVRLLAEALRYRQQVGLPMEIAETLEAIACVKARSESGPAAQLIAAAASIRLGAGVPVAPVDRPALDAAESTIRTALGEGGLSDALARGRALDTEGAVASALHLCAGPSRSRIQT